MLHLVVDPDAPDRAVLATAARLVAAGGVVAYPTDTLYGLAVDPRNVDAVERLFGVKERAGDQPIPLIAADLEQVEREVGRLSALARRLAVRFWPGPLTLVVEALPRISPSVHRGTGRVAVRVPAHVVARGLADASGCAVTSTSANVSGEAAPSSVGAISPRLRAHVDAVLDGGPTPGGLPSTIVDAIGEVPRLVREGVVPWARVLECV